MEESAVVRGVEDTIHVAIYERKTGTGPGILRIEGRLLRADAVNVAKFRAIAVKGRPNFNCYIDGQPVDLQLVKGKVEEEETTLPEDEETKLLAVRREQLRLDVARLEAERQMRLREHASQRQNLEADIRRLGEMREKEVGLLAKESERLDKERKRVDDALKSMAGEIANKQAVLDHLGSLEESLSASLAVRIDAVDDELDERMKNAKEREKEHRKQLKEAAGRGGPTLRSEFMGWFRESAPPDLMKKGLDGIFTKIMSKLSDDKT
jgi:hypothetical protein